MTEVKPLDLVKMLEDGVVEIPELQREFVWSNEQVKDLAESIYNRYPIGMITLYRVPKELATKQGASWVLDGQQRIMSLALIVNGAIPVKAGAPRRAWVWFNPNHEDFHCTEPPRRMPTEWVNLSDILKMNDQSLVQFIQNRSSGEREKIQLLWLRFRDYNLLVHDIHEDLDLDKLGDIFVRTNFAGTRVRGAEVYSTMLAVAAPGIVKQLRGFVDSLNNQRGWDVDYGVAMRIFMAFLTDGRVKLASRVLDQAGKLKDSLQTKKEQIPEIVTKVQKSIVSAIDLLTSTNELAIATPSYEYLPSQNVLVIMAYYVEKRSLTAEAEKRGLLGWFVLASHFGRYGSGTETRLNEDLSEIERGGDYKALVSRLEAREGDLKDRIKESVQTGRGLGKLLLYAILRAGGVKDLTTHQDLTTADATIHHIFPEGVLAGSEWEALKDNVNNLTIATMGTNNALRTQRPETYLLRVPPEIRKTHLIPDTAELWEVQKFKLFIEKRAELLSDAVENFFQRYVP